MCDNRNVIEGTVYLIHLNQPLKHSQHYVGFCVGPTLDRMEEHRAGRGSKMLRAANQEGIAYDVVRVWAGTRETERKLKRRHETTRFCPICSLSPKNL